MSLLALSLLLLALLLLALLALSVVLVGCFRCYCWLLFPVDYRIIVGWLLVAGSAAEYQCR